MFSARAHAARLGMVSAYLLSLQTLQGEAVRLLLRTERVRHPATHRVMSVQSADQRTRIAHRCFVRNGLAMTKDDKGVELGQHSCIEGRAGKSNGGSIMVSTQMVAYRYQNIMWTVVDTHGR